jgi:nucleoside-diphosphate-sugar epimerase
MARILLTGATGFVGGAVLARLRRQGHEVVSLGRSAPAGLPGEHLHLAADLGDPPSILRHREALRGMELVAHLGGAVLRAGGGPAAGALAAGDAEQAQAMRVNAEGTAHLLSVLPAGLAGFCYTSTLDIYGPGEPLAARGFAPDTSGAPPPLSPLPPLPPLAWAPLAEAVPALAEDHPARPATPYAASKLAAETLLGAWSARAGVPLAVLRLSHVYGPGDTSAKAIPAFLAACRRGERPVMRGGADVRDYLYVDDAAAAVTRALELRAAGTFNIAAGRGTSIRDLLAAVQAAAGSGAAADWQPAVRPPTALVLDVARARAVLGWQPQVGLAEGLRRTVAAAADLPAPPSVAGGYDPGLR